MTVEEGGEGLVEEEGFVCGLEAYFVGVFCEEVVGLEGDFGGVDCGGFWGWWEEETEGWWGEGSRGGLGGFMIEIV